MAREAEHCCNPHWLGHSGRSKGVHSLYACGLRSLCLHYAVNPAVSAHSLAFTWRRICLRVMLVWLIEQTYDNRDDSAALAVQIYTFHEEKHS